MELDQAARTRLKDTEAGLFTSDLTVNEYLLLEDAGYEPLGLVLGSSIYHVGYQRRRLRTSHELTVLTEALYHARELAMERMQAEAEQLGADGVVGVRLNFQGFEGARHIAEFLAIGTAVRRRDRTGAPDGRPFTSDLSGQDFWTLLRTGARPLGLVLGTCVYSVTARAFRFRGRLFMNNLEMPELTQALYDARELAMSRMQAEAKALAARRHRRRADRRAPPQLARPRDRIPRRRHRDRPRHAAHRADRADARARPQRQNDLGNDVNHPWAGRGNASGPDRP